MAHQSQHISTFGVNSPLHFSSAAIPSRIFPSKARLTCCALTFRVHFQRPSPSPEMLCIQAMSSPPAQPKGKIFHIAVSPLSSKRSNQSMKPTAPFRSKFGFGAANTNRNEDRGRSTDLLSLNLESKRPGIGPSRTCPPHPSDLSSDPLVLRQDLG